MKRCREQSMPNIDPDVQGSNSLYTESELIVDVGHLADERARRDLGRR